MDSRPDLVVDCQVSQADGYGGRNAAQTIVFDCPGSQQKTTSADKGYDIRGYAQSIHVQRGIKKLLGWIQQFSGLRQFKWQGQVKVSAVFGLHVMAYNLIHLDNLLKPAIAAS